MSFKQMSKIFFRLMVYIVKPRKGRFLFAVCCILFSAFVVSLNIRFTQRVIDDFVTPLLLAHSVDLSALTRAVARQSIIIFAGFLGNLSYTLTMAVIAQREEYSQAGPLMPNRPRTRLMMPWVGFSNQYHIVAEATVEATTGT